MYRINDCLNSVIVNEVCEGVQLFGRFRIRMKSENVNEGKTSDYVHTKKCVYVFESDRLPHRPGFRVVS